MMIEIEKLQFTSERNWEACERVWLRLGFVHALYRRQVMIKCFATYRVNAFLARIFVESGFARPTQFVGPKRVFAFNLHYFYFNETWKIKIKIFIDNTKFNFNFSLSNACKLGKLGIIKKRKIKLIIVQGL